MQKNAKKNKKSLQPVYKPYQRGRACSMLAVKRGWRILGYTLVLTFIFLIVGTALAFDNNILRIVLNAMVALMGMGLFYNDGARMGEGDTAFAEIVHNRKSEGKNVPDSELDRCFHPLKGFVTALCGIAPVLVLALVYALMAEKQIYSLGVLPSWVTAYEDQPEIGQALAYYSQTEGMKLADMLRIVVRLILFPYVNMVGSGNAEGMLLLDRLSPALCLLTPISFGLGYLRGPQLRSLVHGNIRQNKRKHNARERKAREQRAQQMQPKNKPKELI